MPRKQRNPKARREPVNAYTFAYLETGDLLERQELGDGWWQAFEETGDDAVLEAIWREVRAELLEDWIEARPGTRPHGWWRFDAPRWREADKPERARRITCESFPEPRQRLGGVGDPAYAHLNVWPRFRFGLPVDFVSDFDARYYRGLALDVHGKPIGIEFRNSGFRGLAIDPANPPTFESQAAYLDRHELLTATERRRLPADAFVPEQIEVPVADTPDQRAVSPDVWAKPAFNQMREDSH